MCLYMPTFGFVRRIGLLVLVMSCDILFVMLSHATERLSHGDGPVCSSRC